MKLKTKLIKLLLTISCTGFVLIFFFNLTYCFDAFFEIRFFIIKHVFGMTVYKGIFLELFFHACGLVSLFLLVNVYQERLKALEKLNQ